MASSSGPPSMTSRMAASTSRPRSPGHSISRAITIGPTGCRLNSYWQTYTDHAQARRDVGLAG